MANYATLKSAIQQVVKTNGNNEITGALLQQTLFAMVNSLGADYQFMGVATPDTNPGTPDHNVAYLASVPGVYGNFGSSVVAGGIYVLKYNGSWVVEGLLSAVYTSKNPVFTELDWGLKFTGNANSFVRLNSPIILQNNGDSLELYVSNVGPGGGASGGYAFSISPQLGLSISQGPISLRADDGTWLTSTSNDWGGVARKVKILYSGGNIQFYVDDVLKKTYTGQKKVTINGFANPAGYSGSYWSGNIEWVKVNGQPYSLVTNILGEDVDVFRDKGFLLPDQNFLDETDVVDALNSTATNKPLSANQGRILNGSKLYSDLVKQLGWGYSFNGSSSVAILASPINLQSNGDSVEFGIIQCRSTTLAGGGYAFAPNGTSICVGFSGSSLYVRAVDYSWIFQYQLIPANTKSIKISFESGNIVLYADGVVKATHTGQTALRITRIGRGPTSYGWWDGDLSYIKVNNTTIDLLSVAATTDVSLIRANMFLTDQQAKELSNITAEMYVEKSANKIDVFQKLATGKYVHFPFDKRYKTFTSGQYPSFYDNWGIGQLKLSVFGSGTMADEDNLFYPGEAELAVSVPSGADSSNQYVGGASHGFENIVVGDNGREINILVDNQRLLEADTMTLRACKKVEIIQNTQLCQAYTNTNPFAVATKHWVWENGKMKCTTTLKLLRQITFAYAQFGMFCVYRRWVGNTSNPYLTNAAIKNSNPFKIWDVSDGWSGMLQSPDKDCTRIVEYGQMGFGFSMSIESTTTKNSGGMFVATNGLAYNKIYFDMGRSFQAEQNDVLEATQIWEIYNIETE